MRRRSTLWSKLMAFRRHDLKPSLGPGAIREPGRFSVAPGGSESAGKWDEGDSNSDTSAGELRRTTTNRYMGE
jgi:hypothetical protein